MNRPIRVALGLVLLNSAAGGRRFEPRLTLEKE
jgi:hypothetical protein